MNRTRHLLLALLPLLLAACQTAGGPAASPSPAALTAVADACAPDQIETTIEPVLKIMRAFDDTSRLASNTPRAQVAGPIAALQALRRQAEDLKVPDCLLDLKRAQLAHMNAVIDTMMAFLREAPSETVNEGIATARAIRLIYDQEAARLRGITLVPAATLPPPPTAAPADTPVPTPTPVTVTASADAELRDGPALEAALLGVLTAGQTAIAFDRTVAGDWIRVEFLASGSGMAWVSTAQVTVSVPVDQLPIAAP